MRTRLPLAERTGVGKDSVWSVSTSVAAMARMDEAGEENAVGDFDNMRVTRNYD